MFCINYPVGDIMFAILSEYAIRSLPSFCYTASTHLRQQQVKSVTGTSPRSPLSVQTEASSFRWFRSQQALVSHPDSNKSHIRQRQYWQLCIFDSYIRRCFLDSTSWSNATLRMTPEMLLLLSACKREKRRRMVVMRVIWEGGRSLSMTR
jgi:hypothetical protein